MYINISNKRIRKASIIGYFFFVLIVPVLYYFLGINDTKSIAMYVIGIILLPGIMTLATLLQYRGAPSITSSQIIKGANLDWKTIREKIALLSREKGWRIIEEDDQWCKLETPVSLTSFGEYITVKAKENEILINTRPKVGWVQNAVANSSDNVKTVLKSLVNS